MAGVATDGCLDASGLLRNEPTGVTRPDAGRGRNRPPEASEFRQRGDRSSWQCFTESIGEGHFQFDAEPAEILPAAWYCRRPVGPTRRGGQAGSLGYRPLVHAAALADHFRPKGE